MEIKVGKIENYFSKIGVMILKLENELSVNDTIHVKGHTTDFTQVVESMQKEHLQISKGEVGDSVGIKVSERVRKGDIVYKVIP